MAEEVKAPQAPTGSATATKFAKIKNMCAALPSGDTRQRVVLLMTGALNPVHKLHIQSFEIAKRGLEQDPNLVVVGGLLSGSHDEYVRGKLRAATIPFVHRAAMCNLAVKESNWVDFDDWEGKQAGFRDFPAVARHLAEELGKEVPELKLRVLYLCGSDHCIKCHLFNGISRDIGVCVVARPGSPLKAASLRKGAAYLVTDDQASEKDVSSTLVREAVAKGDVNVCLFGSVHVSWQAVALKAMLNADVLAYMHKHDLLGMSKVKLD